MKKIFALIMVMVLVFTLSACNKEESSEDVKFWQFRQDDMALMQPKKEVYFWEFRIADRANNFNG